MFLLPYAGQLVFEGLKSVVKGWGSSKGKEMKEQRKESATIKIPEEIHNNSKLLDEFMKNVKREEIKNNMRFQIELEDPSDIEIVKLPKNIRDQPEKEKEILRNIKELEKKSGKRVKIIYF